jgi:cardiolipin synthase A/B
MAAPAHDRRDSIELASAMSARRLAEQAFSRAAGAPLVAGNQIRLLKDAVENYPAWMEAIRGAQRTIFFENYIIDEDDVGRMFADALAERARAGVKVRLLRDWIGSYTGASRSFWRHLQAAGVEVRAFNPPRWDNPLGWISRDHRKSITVDGRVAFVTGLCLSKKWVGDPARGIEPWRDTGVALSGPAVAYVEQAFAEVWATAGPPLPPSDLSVPSEIAETGDVGVRVVAGAPNSADLFRLDQVIAVAARRTLWLTDAYFVGFAPYVQALRAAAQDGVDVRLLLPGATDIPLIRPLSRAGYESLLDAGIRVWEWNGPMLHAKSAVADGRWARVGSSNLNWASFLGNYELDVHVEDETFAAAMEEMYERDLEHATEIVLTARRRVRATAGAPPRPKQPREARKRSKVAAAGAMRVAHAVGAAVANRRTLSRSEGNIAFAAVVALMTVATIAALWPRAIAWPLAFILTWLAVAVVSRTLRATRARSRRRRHHTSR